eukprot:3464998-Pyramimonas_sp.AAC.1
MSDSIRYSSTLQRARGYGGGRIVCRCEPRGPPKRIGFELGFASHRDLSGLVVSFVSHKPGFNGPAARPVLRGARALVPPSLHKGRREGR